MENLNQSLPNLQINAHLTRQLDLINTSKLNQWPVTIIGCGAVGSFTALALVKMGVTRITLYDDDVVSIENMSNQFFRFKDINTNKALALAALVEDFTGVRLTAHARRFEGQDVRSLTGIVINATDSMATRKDIYLGIKELASMVKLFIDPRMGAEHYTQYTMNPFDAKDHATYLKTLYTDGEAIAERCTAKSTVYTATLAAGMLAKTVKNWVMEEPYPRVTQWNVKSSDAPMVMYPGKGIPPQ